MDAAALPKPAALVTGGKAVRVEETNWKQKVRPRIERGLPRKLLQRDLADPELAAHNARNTDQASTE